MKQGKVTFLWPNHKQGIKKKIFLRKLKGWGRGVILMKKHIFLNEGRRMKTNMNPVFLTQIKLQKQFKSKIT